MTMLTMSVDLDKLEELLREATPGPWVADDFGWVEALIGGVALEVAVTGERERYPWRPSPLSGGGPTGEREPYCGLAQYAPRSHRRGEGAEGEGGVAGNWCGFVDPEAFPPPRGGILHDV